MISDEITSVRATDSVAALRQAFLDNLTYLEGRFFPIVTPYECYMALSYTVRDHLMRRWSQTAQTYLAHASRTVAYFSAEFLLGPQLDNNICNLGLRQNLNLALKGLGLNLPDILAEEPEPGLGNGGLGRLAACFMDSLATLNIPAIGYGIRYEFGIFKQEIQNGWQIERPDKWLRLGNPWEIARPEIIFAIPFGGHTEHYHDENGCHQVRWLHDYLVQSTPFDIPVLGYQSSTANFIRLWKAEATESFDLQSFNDGDYYGAVQNKVASENLTKILYPNDGPIAGKKLRLKQQYFFVSSSLQDMIRIYLQRGSYLGYFHNKYAIQLNDTHPAIGIAELMRLFIDQHHLDWESAWEITIQSFNYTNHTLLPEALETWPLPIFASLLPRHLEIIYEINFRFLQQMRNHFPHDELLIRDLSIIAETTPKKIRMANLACIGSQMINGVSELHTELLKQEVLKPFYQIWPQKFTNITNGITPRRFLKLANSELANLIDSKIGDTWVTDLTHLKQLENHYQDPQCIAEWQRIKLLHKQKLATYVQKHLGVTINPYSLFDIQAKRIHEYKRQHLNLLQIVASYQQLHLQPNCDFIPRTYIFAGKAAPGYRQAKLIIKLINEIAHIINHDPLTKDRLQVIFFPNFNVGHAQLIYPAADLSEQISTAGMEASGTGNMKFALNGALTIGTLDGANIEIRQAVGTENFFLFGLTTDEIKQLLKNNYQPRHFIEQNQLLKETLNLLHSPHFLRNPEIFTPLLTQLEEFDPFCVCADFAAYYDCQQQVAATFKQQKLWTMKSILNTARIGKFSSDRAILEYCQKIWHIQPVKPGNKH